MEYAKTNGHEIIGESFDDNVSGMHFNREGINKIYEQVEQNNIEAIISGHRRFRAAQKAGLAEVPAFIRPVSRDEAAIMVVDSNLHREHLLPSEKAFAYKLKAEALKHQGQRNDLTSEQLAPKL